jgi:hypothetical protein
MFHTTTPPLLNIHTYMHSLLHGRNTSSEPARSLQSHPWGSLVQRLPLLPLLPLLSRSLPCRALSLSRIRQANRIREDSTRRPLLQITIHDRQISQLPPPIDRIPANIRPRLSCSARDLLARLWLAILGEPELLGLMPPPPTRVTAVVQSG